MYHYFHYRHENDYFPRRPMNVYFHYRRNMNKYFHYDMYHYRRNNQDRTDKYPDNVCTSTAAEDRQVYHYHRHVNNYFPRRF